MNSDTSPSMKIDPIFVLEESIGTCASRPLGTQTCPLSPTPSSRLDTFLIFISPCALTFYPSLLPPPPLHPGPLHSFPFFVSRKRSADAASSRKSGQIWPSAISARRLADDRRASSRQSGQIWPKWPDMAIGYFGRKARPIRRCGLQPPSAISARRLADIRQASSPISGFCQSTHCRIVRLCLFSPALGRGPGACATQWYGVAPVLGFQTLRKPSGFAPAIQADFAGKQ
jgi:hypothetical protein